jgi:hypothetical protein
VVHADQLVGRRMQNRQRSTEARDPLGLLVIFIHYAGVP